MKNAKTRLLLLLLIGFVSLCGHGQNLSTNGRFPSKYFSLKDYGSAAQIWGGIQNKQGTYIFGNRQDILTFNGNEWGKIKVDKEKTPKNIQTISYGTYVSHFYEASNNRIYVGRENNFGYLDYSGKGELTYFPIFAKSDKDGFGKIWNITEVNNGEVVFIGEKGVFSYNNKKVTPIALPSEVNGMITRTSCRVDRGILISYQKEEEDGTRSCKYVFLDILTGKVKVVSGPKEENYLSIRGSFDIDGKWYVLNINKKLYEVSYQNGQLNWKIMPATFFPYLQNYAPIFIKRVGSLVYYCTENGGLIISNLKGDIFRIFDFNDNLENIFVNNFFLDHDKNIWLCLDNGIQFIESSSPVTFLRKKEGSTSQIECIEFVNNQSLIGLHTDIFKPETRDYHGYLESVNLFRQYVFDIETLETDKGKRTLVIGYDGLYEYFPTNNTYAKVESVYALSFCKDPTNNNRVFITLEQGLGQLEWVNGKWIYSDIVPNAGGETVSAVYFNHKIYFSIRNKGIGIYNTLTKKYRLFAIKNQDKDNNNYYVQQFRNQVFVGTGNGLFTIDRFDKKLTKFAQNDELFGTAGKNTFHRIVNIDDSQLWVVIYREFSDANFEFETGWLEEFNGTWKYTKWPLAGLKDAGIISAIEKNANGEIWLGANEGLFFFNRDAVHKRTSNLKVYIDKFAISGETRYYDIGHTKQIAPLEYSQNSFKITFHSNFYSAQGPTMFRYKLEGFNDKWTDWSNLNFANFEKLGEGSYTLKIQARNFYGQESEVFSYEISILPPWYRTTWAYILYLIILIFIIFGVVQLSTQRVKRQNIRLEEIVRERTSEIAEQNNQLEKQKEEITQKTIDILDSIHYAKRIQTTILPTEARLNELFEEQFVFYRPKDIVSGDFYWAREVQGKMIFSAIDCTGHGVPGALVSIVGNNGLLRAVNEFKLTEPNEILDKLREIVLAAFQSDGQLDVKDGMDMALCSIDYQTGELKFAGANNECVIIRNGEIIELKPDKQPIGQFINAKPFNQQSYQLEPGDCIYLYTDGYVDQFGGDRLKKFKSKPFKNLLAEIAGQSMKEQYAIVQRTFDDWKSDVEQVDDVCVVAVKFKGKRK